MAKSINSVVVNIRIAMIAAFLACGVSNAAEISKFREESYHPNVVQREGLALLRIVGSPMALITEGKQFYDECSEANGHSMPLSFLTGSVIGCFVMGGEIVGGTIELVTFQQVKDWAYPWEFDDPDPESIARMRGEGKENKQEEPNFLAEAVGAAVGAAAGAAVEQSIKKSHKGGNTYASPSSSSGGRSKKSSVKPRVKHSSCGGTGTCPICRGRGTVGNGIKCSGCGGSKRCRACRGTGYAN